MSFEYSVVATTYNDSETIKEYLINIVNQSVKPKEIVIADGGSGDNTCEIIKEFSKQTDIHIILLSGSRLNIAEGYNAAISNASAEWIGITGIGNTYDKDYFKELSLFINEYDIVYSPIRGLDMGGFSSKYCKTFLNGINGNDIGMPSNHGCLIKKDIFIENGMFYERFIYAGEDAEFYKILKDKHYKMKLAQNAKVLWHIPTSFAEYRKQVKNYTIGDMQLNNNTAIIYSMIKKGIFCVFCVLFLLAMFNVLEIKGLLYGTLLYVVIIILFKIKNKDKSIILLIYAKFAPMYFIIANRCYLKEEYKVRRG